MVIVGKHGPLAVRRLDKAPEKPAKRKPAPRAPRVPAPDHPWRGEERPARRERPATPKEITAFAEQYLGNPIYHAAGQG